MRLYVTGGTGLVGSHVIKVAQEDYHAEVIASLYGPPPDDQVTYELDPLNLADHDAISRSIQKYKPDVVIHSAALLDQALMYREREMAWSLMVGATRTLAKACREVNARMIFISSDWVFDGTQDVVNEDSAPHPVNFYGIMKVASERELSAMDDLNFAVARLAGVYGENIAVRSLTRREQGLGFELANYVLKRLKAGQFADIWVGPKVNDMAHPTLASDSADLLMRLAGREETGIFHCVGSDAVSRLDFALHIAQAFGYDPGLVKPVPTDPAVLAEHAHIAIPFRTRMSQEKTVKTLGRTPLGVRDGVQVYKAEWEARNA